MNGSGLVRSQSIFWLRRVHFCNHDILLQLFVDDFFQRFASLFKRQNWFIFITRYWLEHLLWFVADARFQSRICFESTSHVSMFRTYFQNGEIRLICYATQHACFDEKRVVQINGKIISTERKLHLFSFFHRIMYCFSIENRSTNRKWVRCILLRERNHFTNSFFIEQCMIRWLVHRIICI